MATAAAELPTPRTSPASSAQSVIERHMVGPGKRLVKLVGTLLARVLAGAHDGVVEAADGAEDLALLLRGHAELVEGAGEVLHDGVEVGLLEAEALVRRVLWRVNTSFFRNGSRPLERRVPRAHHVKAAVLVGPAHDHGQELALLLVLRRHCRARAV